MHDTDTDNNVGMARGMEGEEAECRWAKVGGK